MKWALLVIVAVVAAVWLIDDDPDDVVYERLVRGHND
jgi:hypothetical protein